MTPPHFYIFVIISPLKRTWPFIWWNLISLHSRIIRAKFDEFWLDVLEKKIFKNVQCIFTLLLLPPLGEGQSPSFEQIWIPFPKDDLFWVLLELAKWFWRRFSNDPTPFFIFVIISPLKRIWPFIWTKMSSHPMIFVF
jgi:hypothetical protein